MDIVVTPAAQRAITEHQKETQGAPFQLSGSLIQQPVDIQNHYQTTIQTHNAVSIATVSSSTSTSWISCNGFDKLAITLMLDAALNNVYANVLWSNDGVTTHGTDTYGTPGSSVAATTSRAGETSIKADYYKLQIINGDTVSHTVSCWGKLKA